MARNSGYAGPFKRDVLGVRAHITECRESSMSLTKATFNAERSQKGLVADASP